MALPGATDVLTQSAHLVLRARPVVQAWGAQELLVGFLKATHGHPAPSSRTLVFSDATSSTPFPERQSPRPRTGPLAAVQVPKCPRQPPSPRRLRDLHQYCFAVSHFPEGSGAILQDLAAMGGFPPLPSPYPAPPRGSADELLTHCILPPLCKQEAGQGHVHCLPLW